MSRVKVAANYVNGVVSDDAGLAKSTTIWEAPPVGWMKMNVDATVGVKECFFGAVMRDSRGNFVGATKLPITKVDPTLAEMLAMEQGIILAVNMCSRKAIFEGDCSRVVEILSRVDAGIPWEMTKCLTSCRSLLGRIQFYSFNHVRREGNMAAHYLAQSARSLVASCCMFIPDDELCTMLAAEPP